VSSTPRRTGDDRVMSTLEPDVVLTGRFEAGDERHYVEIPFEVPNGLRQLHLHASYNDQIGSDPLLSGGNTLDLGLFDNRGTTSGGPGFCGWSGSTRLDLTVGETWSTPPYRPGPLGAGTWHVLLGPYKVGPHGLDYRIEISFDPGLPPEPELPVIKPLPAAQLPPAAEAGWVRGDLHCHSRRSDGDASPAEMLRAAAAAGLDFLAITDHNSPPDSSVLGPVGGPVVIPGIEVTTYGGHWNVWGTTGWYDFRDPSPDAVRAALRAAIGAGGLVSVNHPKPFGPPWVYGDDLDYAAIEVWNGPWERLNALALNHWDAQLRRGRRIVAVGGSDTHRLRAPRRGPLGDPRLGHPTTWVRIEGAMTAEAILTGIRQGRCFISASPAGPQLYLARMDGAVRVHAVGASGAALLMMDETSRVSTVALGSDDWAAIIPFPASARYLRAQIVDAGEGMLALSNPVWRDGGEEPSVHDESPVNR